MTDLILHRDADDEIRHAVSYYEDQAVGLGLDFLAEVRGAFLRIQEAPERWARAGHGARKLQLDRFPHTIYYRTFSEFIWILAVAQQRPEAFLLAIPKAEPPGDDISS